MIRFLLPVLLLAFGACQVPNQSSDTSATPAALAAEVADEAACTDCEEATTASLEAPSDCCSGEANADADADVTAAAMAAEGDCCSEGAEVEVLEVVEVVAANMDACALKAAGVCEDGGDCPMQAAGNMECSEMGTESCPMEQAKAKAAAESAVQASLMVTEGCCEGKTVAEACEGCAAKATAAAMAQCEGMDPAHCEGQQGDCPMAAAKAAATAAAGSESCAMQTAAAMKQCEGMDPAQCEGMDPAQCEAMKAACEANAECPSMEAPASVETGATEATQAGTVKKEEPSCCSGKSAEPSN